MIQPQIRLHIAITRTQQYELCKSTTEDITVFRIERKSGEAEEGGLDACLLPLGQTVYEGCNRKCYPYVEAQYDRAEDTSVV